MLKHLWVRLSLAFALVAIIVDLFFAGALIIVLRSNIFERSLVDGLSGPGRLVDRLVTLYSADGSWDRLESVMGQQSGAFVPGPRGGIIVTIQNPEGQFVFDPTHVATNPKYILLERLPIPVDGQPVGFVTLYRLPPPDRGMPDFDQQLATAVLVVAGFGLVLGTLSGILVSRLIARPMNRLARGVRHIGPRELSVRVAEEGPTEVRGIARAFNEVIERLENAETLRRNMVADIAHELRTPVTVLQGNLMALLQDVYTPDKSEIAKLYDQTRLLRRLVTDLHELTQAEARQLPLNLEAVDITALAGDAVEAFRALAELHDLQLNVELPAQPVVARIDSARLHQIISNLLMNALQHTPEGSTVTIRLQHNDGRVSLHVQDTGEGIPPDSLPHVFDRFYRVDSSRSRNSGGAGLGLAIVKALSEAQGGQAAVSSSGIPGEGATFSVSFPEYLSDRLPESVQAAFQPVNTFSRIS